MNNTKYTIYWTDKDGKPGSMLIYNLQIALSAMESMRAHPDHYSAVTFCSENADQVGKPGVDAVVNGVLPDGLEYVYKTGRDRGRDPR
jgi:hypothetical protein